MSPSSLVKSWLLDVHPFLLVKTQFFASKIIIFASKFTMFASKITIFDVKLIPFFLCKKSPSSPGPKKNARPVVVPSDS